MSDTMLAASKSLGHLCQHIDSGRQNVAYPLMNVVVIAACAVICGADNPVAIAEFGRKKHAWLARFLDLQDGIPSHDRFHAILAAIKPSEFMKYLFSWVTALDEVAKEQVAATDGGMLRRSFDVASSKAVAHGVKAWATASHIRLEQVKADFESNEMATILKLLEILDLPGSIATLDAMSCQPAIARKITEAGGDYVLAVNENQPVLYQGIANHFEDHLHDHFARTRVRRYEEEETKHGQQETRWHFVCPVPEGLPDRSRWPDLKAIGIAVRNTRQYGIDCNEHRYYILSEYLSARHFANAVWDHGSVDDRLCWRLDVTFGEAQCYVHQGHADANVSLLRRTAFSMLKNEPTLEVGIKNKRLTAGWDESYLKKVLLGS